jgi:hypothetical protein
MDGVDLVARGEPEDEQRRAPIGALPERMRLEGALAGVA